MTVVDSLACAIYSLAGSEYVCMRVGMYVYVCREGMRVYTHTRCGICAYVCKYACMYPYVRDCPSYDVFSGIYIHVYMHSYVRVGLHVRP